MRRRTAHEMDEWPAFNVPWYVKFWRFVYVWMAVVVLLVAFGTYWRIYELKNARVEDCTGVVKSIRTVQPMPGTGADSVIYAQVQIEGKALEIPVNRKTYPGLRVGDKINLTCRVGRHGTLFVQKWRPDHTSP